MNKPTRPTTVFRTTDRGVVIDVDDGHYRPGRRFLDRSESEVYMDAIEQERDEALEFIRGLYSSGQEPNCKFSFEGLWMTGVQEQARCFIARIDGGNNE